jgi:hypothetical protein
VIRAQVRASFWVVRFRYAHATVESIIELRVGILTVAAPMGTCSAAAASFIPVTSSVTLECLTIPEGDLRSVGDRRIGMPLIRRRAGAVGSIEGFHLRVVYRSTDQDGDVDVECLGNFRGSPAMVCTR